MSGTEREEHKMLHAINNPVAKHACKFNKASVHRDHKNDYRRKPKHPKKDW